MRWAVDAGRDHSPCRARLPQNKEPRMVENHNTLPPGAGAETGTPIANAAAVTSHPGTADADQTSHRELVVLERRASPATGTVVGAVIAGAIAGGAIPFLLSGRSSGRSTSSDTRREDSLVVESVIINRPAREIYDFWRDFTNLSRFMDNIKSVQTLSATRSHWVIKAPAGTSVEFNSRVTDDVPGRAISWESEEGATVPNRGRVEFVETASGNGTNVRVTMSYDPPAGVAGRVVAKLFQREPSVQAREDLTRLKALMEGGPASL
jgi:uncharacterized membrane protein